MMRIAGRILAVLTVSVLIGSANADDRSADVILKEIAAIPAPKSFKEFQANAPKKVALIDELYKVAPDNEKLVKLMSEKWMTQMNLNQAEEVQAQVKDVLAHSKSDKLKVEAAYVSAVSSLRKTIRTNPEASIGEIDTFMKLAPKDERGPSLLYATVSRTEDKAKKASVEDRILKDFPESSTAESIKGERRQAEGVGKPFELEFTDAIKETQVSMKNLKGKVVVVDFWATWCGPCVAEMPNMKKLYAEFKDKGVEFIGVSLDQKKEDGGLDALKEFVAKNEITWPQYYQGNYWQSEFSRSWGINGIPCVFIVDTEGNLFSTEARGKLETLIPELLKKAKPAPGAGGQ